MASMYPKAIHWRPPVTVVATNGGACRVCHARSPGCERGDCLKASGRVFLSVCGGGGGFRNYVWMGVQPAPSPPPGMGHILGLVGCAKGARRRKLPFSAFE